MYVYFKTYKYISIVPSLYFEKETYYPNYFFRIPFEKSKCLFFNSNL